MAGNIRLLSPVVHLLAPDTVVALQAGMLVPASTVEAAHTVPDFRRWLLFTDGFVMVTIADSMALSQALDPLAVHNLFQCGSMLEA